MLQRLIVLFSVLLMIPLSAAAAEQKPDLSNVTNALMQYFPRVQAEEVAETPIQGLYEVLLEKGNIIYFFPASGHIVTGELWSSQNRNLTQESKSRRMSAKLNMFPLDKAIKIGDGPNIIIEVTDPDCPFCRKASEFFHQRDDVTRYVFLFPLDRIHPKAAAKAKFILASEDQAASYYDVFNGMYDREMPPALDDKGLLDEHRQIAAKVGINGTPQFWINGQHVSGFNPKQFTALLNKKAQ